MPPIRRDRPASSAASLNVLQRSRTSSDGATPVPQTRNPARTIVDAPNRSLPVIKRNTCAALALKALCPSVFGERRRRNIWTELSAIDFLYALSGPAPRTNQMSVEEIPDGADRSHIVIESLAVPHRDAGIEQGVAEDEEHFDVLLHVVLVPARYPLCEQIPMSWRRLGVRSVGPIQCDRFQPIVEMATQPNQGLGLFDVLGRSKWRRRLWPKLIRIGESERGDQSPVGRVEDLHCSICKTKRLPAIRIREASGPFTGT